MSVENYSTLKGLIERQQRCVWMPRASLSGVGVRTFSLCVNDPVTAGPGAAVVCDRTTAPGFWQANPGAVAGSITKPLWLAESQIVAAGNALGGTTPFKGVGILFDRLSHQSGLNGTLTTEQTTNLPTAALTRYTSGVGVMIGVQAYTGVGSTSVTISARYTNSDGVANRTTPGVVFSSSTVTTNGMALLPLEDGDLGARSVEGITLSASTGTAGDFGVVLFKPIAVLADTTRGRGCRNHAFGGSLIELDDDACLQGYLQHDGILNANYNMRLVLNVVEEP
jgi:hypothetical protein